MNTAIYLLNRLSTKSLENKTAFEAWNGYKPSVEHLKVFGSACYAHVPEVKRNKLDARVFEGIFIGYGEVTKGYRIFNLRTKRVEVSRDVKVDEKLTWNWEKNVVERANDQLLSDEISEANENEDVNSENIDHIPVRGTRSLQDIYDRYNMAMIKPADVQEAFNSDVWNLAM